MLLDFEKTLSGKKILVTGHTGFTGGWTCHWLKNIGVNVFGYSLAPETNPSLFIASSLSAEIHSTIADINDYATFLDEVREVKPEAIIHLAAQPLVRKSYLNPLETFQTNVMGTANVLEAARQVKSVKAVLCITTDKVYKNNELLRPFRENDELGGKDPYSGSKSAAELVIQSYTQSFPAKKSLGPLVAVARGGNIIGGGDWSQDRLVPDFIRAVVGETDKLSIRYPDAIRPWQHVLALVYGYLLLLSKLLSEEGEKYAKAWNFGPNENQPFNVSDIIELMSACWKRPNIDVLETSLPEAGVLTLDSNLARSELGWNPPWATERVIRETIDWYRSFYEGETDTKKLISEQINVWRKELQA